MKVRSANLFFRAVVLSAVAVSAGSILGQAQTFNNIYSFTGAGGDGEYPFPYGHLSFDSSGDIYGTTAGGGSGYNGTVFELVPKSGGGWTEKILYEFAGDADGRQPSAGVVFDASGNLYGTTSYGGNNQACGGGCGTVFELSPPAQSGGAWTHTVLYTFQGGFDGAQPGAAIIESNGALYGPTSTGGTPAVLCNSNRKIKSGCGTIFELAPPAQKGGAWTKSILYTFPGATGDGTTPSRDIVADGEGNLYGVTGAGGTSHYGIAYKLSPPAGGSGAWTETVLHNFTGGSDGGYPGGTLTPGPNGIFYGTASYSGVANESGVVFQLTPPAQSGGAWTENVLHTFPAFNGDGTTPASTMAIDASGNLYGTTDFGGSTACYLGCGTVFKLAPPSGVGSWTGTILHDWGNSGQTPDTSLVDLHGNLLYGTATYQGAEDLGSAFTLVP
jgi:hypothetical protein